MTNNTLLDALQVQLGSKIITSEVLYDTLVIEISPSEAFDVIELLKNDTTLSFNFLTLIGAVHYPEEKGREL
jgi:NADH-quinone oxidoreductase subunit C